MQIRFSKKALLDYFEWQDEDRKLTQRLNKIIQEIMRSPYVGIGKPEPLKHEFVGYWSRRLDEKNRIVYKVVGDDEILIVQCNLNPREIL